MKIVKIIVAFMAFAMLATGAFGQELLLGSDGSIKNQQHAVEYTSTGVDVSQSAWEYPEAVEKAYKNPNTPITVSWEKVVFGKPDFWHLTKVTKGEKAILYDVDTASIQIIPSEEIQKNQGKDLFVIFLLISAILMFISYLFLRIRNDIFSVVIALVAAFVAAFAAIAAADAESFFAFLVAVAAFLVAAFFVLEGIEKHNNSLYVIYYVLLFVSGVLYFWSF